MTKRLVRKVLAVAATIVVGSGCGGCDETVEPGQVTGPLELDGLLIVHDGSVPPFPSLVLFDPVTGATSAPFGRDVAISPDLTRIAYRTDSSIVIAEVVRDGNGAPALATRVTIPKILPPDAVLAFNAQGDRLGGAGWFDARTGQEVSPDGGVPAPDGRHRAAGVLYDDAADPMPLILGGSARSFSSDGQWVIAAGGPSEVRKLALAHVETRSIPQHYTNATLGWDLPLDPGTGEATHYLGSDGRGRLLFGRGGRSGLVITARACGDFGEMTCYDIVPSPQTVMPITRIRPGALVDGVAGATETTPLAALEDAAAPPDIDGYDYAVVAVTPDARRAIVQRRPYRIELGDLLVPYYDHLALQLFAVELGGSGTLEPLAEVSRDEGELAARAVANGCGAETNGVDLTPPLFPGPGERLRGSSYLRFLDEHDFVCGNSEGYGSPLAYVGGKARSAPAPGGLVTHDGASLIGGGPQFEDGLCQTAVDGSDLRCTAFAREKRPIAQVAIHLSPRVTSGPIVTALSHRAALPGTEVRVLGYGFGTSGTLRIGEHVIGAPAISSWTDTAIAFAQPADAPDIGPVSVEVGGGRSSQRHLWLGRSEPWQGAPKVPFDLVTVRQGITRVAFPGAGVYQAALRGLDQIFPAEPLVVLTEGAGPDHLDAMELATPPVDRYRWFSFSTPTVDVFRPLLVQPGVAPGGPWQPIGETAPATGERLAWTGGKLVLWQPLRAAWYVRDTAPTGDWGFGSFAMHPSYPRMPGLSTATFDGEEIWTWPPVARRTSWGTLGTDVVYPISTAVTATFANAINNAAARGSVIAVQVQDPQWHSTHVSTDGGASFTVAVPAQFGRSGRWELAVDGPSPGVYGRVMNSGVETVARVSPTGAYSDGIAPAQPAGMPCEGGYQAFERWLLCHVGAARLFSLDTSLASGAAWVEVGGTNAGHIGGLYPDRGAGRLLVGTDAGEILATTDLVAWTHVDTVTLGGVQVALAISALATLPDGGLLAVVHRTPWSNARIVVRPGP